MGHKLPPKMISCEAVLSEVYFLTRNIPAAKDRIESWFTDGRLELPFSAHDHHTPLHELMVRYASVLMSELWPEAPVFTLDSYFRIYRRNKRQSLLLICP